MFNKKETVMMKLIPLSALVAYYLGSLPLANAQELPSQDGFWVGSALGAGLLSESVLLNSALGTKEKSDTRRFSGKIDVGYDFNHYVGLYGSYDFAQHALSNHNLHLASFGVKGNERLTEKLSLFGKAGATYLFGGDNDNGLIGSVGLGLEYQLTNAVAVRLGADYYNDLEISPTRSGDLIQVYWGMTYRFAQPDTPMIITKSVEVIKEVPVEVIKEVPVEVIKEVPVEVIKNVFSSSIRFANNSSALILTKSLEEALDRMKKDGKLKVYIVGHTDSEGSAKYNLWMSEQRAKSVRNFFTTHGISPSRITILGKGEYDPIANNNSVLGRAQNRRVEITVE